MGEKGRTNTGCTWLHVQYVSGELPWGVMERVIAQSDQGKKK